MKRNRNSQFTELKKTPLSTEKDTSRRDYMKASLKEYKLSPEELKEFNDRLSPRPSKEHRLMNMPVRKKGGAA